MSIILQDKFFGCICGCHIGSAMGAPVEGMTYEEIDRKYGYVPYQHYGNGWDREPGTTEDGVERQKLMISAIMEKEGRVTAEDVRAAWNKYANPNAGGWVSEPFEGVLLKMAKTGIRSWQILRLRRTQQLCKGVSSDRTDQRRQCRRRKRGYPSGRTAVSDNEQPRAEMGMCHWRSNSGGNEARRNRGFCDRGNF